MTSKTEITATPDCNRLAAIHAACFPKGWDAEAFAALLSVKGTVACLAEDGFGLLRCLGEEAELLGLAVMPAARRSGLAKRLLDDLLAWAGAQGARAVLLEVNENNRAALRLYEAAGFRTIARRMAYYDSEDGATGDALVMQWKRNQV